MAAWGVEQLKAMERQWGIDLDTPWQKLSSKQRDLCLRGASGKKLTVQWNSEKIKGAFTTEFEGLLNSLMRRYLATQSEHQKRLVRPVHVPQHLPYLPGTAA